ncbi:spore coat protein U domain-containing protein [Lysobacter cavernae]|uniref:Spore coat protein U domain-containing protein n=1 Tax=Lysobacter cavernae TaxID=1685901 RepID=A0ABV7RNQ0_9GAMM
MTPYPIRLILLAVLALCWPDTASAQLACAATMGDIRFGNVNQVGTAGTDVNGMLRVECSGAVTPYVRACVEVGPSNGSWDPRYLSGPDASMLAWYLCKDAACSQVWGSVDGGTAQPMVVDLAVGEGSTHAGVAYLARLPSQNDARAGTYRAQFGAGQARVRAIGYEATPPECGADMPEVARFAFSVEATVESDCAVSASTLDFGRIGSTLESPVQAASTITVTCTHGVDYAIAIDAGRGPGALTTQRKLVRTGGSQTLDYDLYSDSARLQPWGDGSGGSGVVRSSGIGVQTPRQYTVYGTIPVQPLPPSGDYSDTVTVTVTY